MQTYNTISNIPTAQHNRRQHFAQRVADATSPKFLKALAAFARVEFKGEPLKQKEALELVRRREAEIKRGTSDDVQSGEADTNDINLPAAPIGWGYVTA